jgi:hypothetical protein
VTALLTTGCDISSASAAAVKLESSTTFTKMAMSVRFCICVDSGNKSHAARADDPAPARD